MSFLRSKFVGSLRPMTRGIAIAVLGLTAADVTHASDGAPLAGTQPLQGERDFSAEMRAGFRRFFQRQIDDSVSLRSSHWSRDFSSRAAYEKSVEPNRARLRKIIGAVDARLQAFPGPELIATVKRSALVGETEAYTAHAV